MHVNTYRTQIQFTLDTMEPSPAQCCGFLDISLFKSVYIQYVCVNVDQFSVTAALTVVLAAKQITGLYSCILIYILSNTSFTGGIAT